MKNILFIIFFQSFSIFAWSQKIKRSDMKQVEYHLKILDSIANKNTSEILLNCYESIRFMEKITCVEATTDGNYLGRFSCKKSDLQKWHEWYDKKYKKVTAL